MADPKPEPESPISEKDVKAPNLLERAKEEIEAIFHHDKSPRHEKSPSHEKSPRHGKSPRHDYETHGRSDEIDEDTPIEDVRGPSVFERAKEEVEAIVEAILPKKDSKDH